MMGLDNVSPFPGVKISGSPAGPIFPGFLIQVAGRYQTNWVAWYLKFRYQSDKGWYRTTKHVHAICLLKITLQGINISHLGKRKIIFKMPFLGGYVSFLEGILTLPKKKKNKILLPLKKQEKQRSIGIHARYGVKQEVFFGVEFGWCRLNIRYHLHIQIVWSNLF